MGGSTRREEICPQLLDLIPKNREWLMRRDNNSSTSKDERSSHGSSSDEKKLELRLGLGPPGENWPLKNDSGREIGGDEDQKSLLSLGYRNQTPWPSSGKFQGKTTSFLHLPVAAKEASQPCCPQVQKNAEKKAFSPATNTAVPNSSSQKRTAPAPVVGWPPIRSFRKNLASSSSSKPATTESQNDKIPRDKPVETSGKGLFVKINMDGVPIGRKVDLKAYDSYQKLSSAVDELFRGLLAAQRDSSAGGIQIKQEEEKAITGLLDGSGEYTLVYEDNEGDRMLVGDVPWQMFVSTVKRLRVLKSSELSALSLVSGKQDRMALDSSLK
ncbi:Auxin-responsive protein IAA26 [Morus notabilis]|uniref:Auxin-responsive protein n=1 Tax=Morus notabilis TaxID=981085 RepID=W9R6D0_9ROSA|nr:auxin-responsive protein IAA26 isoform X1 [Morus notabilis]EXB74586.1 Auxin-responsive protein IAA26 [Morus notabilis]